MAKGADQRGRPASNAAPSVSGAVARFALVGVIALAVVGVVSFLVMRHIGTSEAIDNASEVTGIVGRGIVQPNLSRGLLEGRPSSIARFDGIVRRRALRDPIVRVKLWTRSGRLVYSDEPRLIGKRYRLGADDLRALRTGEVASDVSDLSRPENRFERGRGKLLQVYMPVRAPSGRPLLFEAYQRFSSVASSGRSLWLAFAPALIGALLILELIQLPLASSMAKRVRRGHQQREALLQRAVDASTAERRRIAGDLHDGIVQDLAGLSYSLSAAADRVESNGEGSAGADLRRGASQTRETVRGLRSLLVEIYPPSLREAGLAAALSDLVAPLGARGIDATATVADELQLSAEQEALVFRVAQEAVRNAAKHGQPGWIQVRVTARPGGADLLVKDDGRGFDSEGEPAAEGHMGLQLMRDLAADTGADLEVESARGRGTRIRLKVSTA